MDKTPVPLGPPETPAAADGPIDQPSVGTGRSSHFAVVGLFLLAALFTIYFARSLLLPIVLALLFALLLSPAVRGLKRAGVPEPAGAGVVVLTLVGTIATAAYLLAEPAILWVGRAPQSLEQIEDKLRSLKKSVANVKQATEKVESITEVEGGKKPREVVVKGPSLGGVVITKFQYVAGGFIAMMILLYFLLASGDLILRKVVRVTTGLRDKIRAVEVGREIERQIGRYFVTVTISNTGLGVATAISMALLGMPNPILWGVVAATLHFIPYLGSSITLVILTVVSLMTFDDLSRVWPVPVTFLALTFIEGQLVQPIFCGRRLSLNPVVIFLSLLFWGWAWGIAGMLIAVPVLVTVKIFCDHVERWHAVGEFLGRD